MPEYEFEGKGGGVAVLEPPLTRPPLREKRKAVLDTIRPYVDPGTAGKTYKQDEGE